MESNYSLLCEAQEELRAAYNKMLEVSDNMYDSGHGSKAEYYKAYIIDHLRILIDGDHGFLSRDANLDNWIDELKLGKVS